MDTKIYGSQGSAAILGILRPRDVAPGESFAHKKACEGVTWVFIYISEGQRNQELP